MVPVLVEAGQRPQVLITFSLAVFLSVQMLSNIYPYDFPIFLYPLMQSKNIFDLKPLDVLEFLDMKHCDFFRRCSLQGCRKSGRGPACDRPARSDKLMLLNNLLTIHG